MSGPLVSLRAQTTYDPGPLREAIADLLAPLGGIEAFVSSGDRVVLKPNLVMGIAPEKAATTHPAIVRAVAELALECGARVAVGDSPGIGSCRSAARSAGVLAALEGLPVDLIEFTAREVTLERGTYRRQSLAAELLDADVVINLPKLKTHQQMLMTMAVKNLFGAVVGGRKFQWHYRAGRDRLTFAGMLGEVCRAVRPALSVVDAVVAMDGSGPTHGTPNPTGFLAAGANPWAVDAVLLDVLGIDRNRLYTLQAAEAAGDIDWKQATPLGTSPESLRPTDWNLPETVPVGMIAGSFAEKHPRLGRWLRRLFTAHPVVQETRCKRCGACIRICPANAMQMTDEGVCIDTTRCIECYCCDELCPHDAIQLTRGWVGRWIGC